MVLTRWTKLGYGLGHVFNDLCSAMWFTYSLIFYEKILQFSRINTGALMLIGQVADAFSTPVIGVLMDRTYLFSRYGKRKSWHLIGTGCVILTMPLVYSPCLMCGGAAEWLRLLYYALFICVFQLGWAAVQIAHLALVPDLTNDESERTDLLAIRNQFATLSNLATYIVTWIVLERDKSREVISPHDALRFQIIDYSICIIGVVTSILFHWIVKEGNSVSHSSIYQVPVRLSMRKLFSKVELYEMGLVYAASRLFCNISQSLISLYLHDDLGLKKESIAVVPFVMYVSSFLTSFITSELNEFLGRKLAYTAGCVTGLSACIWMWLGSGHDYKTYCIYAVAALIGATYSVQLVTSLAITADFIGNDLGNGAFIYGIMSFADKFCSGAAIMAIQSIANKTIIHFYTRAIVYVCGTSAVVGLVALLTIRFPRLQVEVESEG